MMYLEFIIDDDDDDDEDEDEENEENEENEDTYYTMKNSLKPRSRMISGSKRLFCCYCWYI